MKSISIFIFLLFALNTFTSSEELYSTNIQVIPEIEVSGQFHTYDNDFSINLTDPEIPEEVSKLLEQIKTGFLTSDTELIQSLFQQQAIIQASGETPVGNFSSGSGANLSEVPYESFIQAIETGNWQDIEMQDIKVIQHPRFSELFGVQFTSSFNTENSEYRTYVFHLVETDAEEITTIILMSVWQQLEITEDSERFSLDDLEIL